MDSTVENFFTKNPESNYLEQYEYSHGPRLDALVEHFGFKNLKNQRVVDIGGGLGFLGKRLDSSNDYLVIDGAEVTLAQRLCQNMSFRQFDLDHDNFGDKCLEMGEGAKDIAFFLETIEHIGNPHHALVEIKKLVKPDAQIVISIPTEVVTHNSPYPSLLWPENPNFRMFLNQMALPVLEFWHYKPSSIGWPAYHYLCRNAPWIESKMLFHKDEEKFRGVTPLQATNL